MAADFKQVIDEMKGKGIETALVKREGGLVYSTFGMEDPAPYVSQYLANNAQLLMAELGDEAKEIEITFPDRFLVLIPLDSYILVALVKTREDKKVLRGYVDSIKSMF
ncbi:Uncharacterised protein [uncultured archaeon]|nr:Uncharacterised protein [uncultured archaeon]